MAGDHVGDVDSVLTSFFFLASLFGQVKSDYFCATILLLMSLLFQSALRNRRHVTGASVIAVVLPNNKLSPEHHKRLAGD